MHHLKKSCIPSKAYWKKLKKKPILLSSDFNFDMLQDGDAQTKFLLFINNNYFTFHRSKATIDMGSMFWTYFPNDAITFSIFNAYWTDHHDKCLPRLL